MKTILISLILCANLISAFAFADTGDIPLVSVNTELFPTQTYAMGINVDPKTGSFTGLFYLNPYLSPNLQKKVFSFQDLKEKPQALLSSSGYDVVTITFDEPTLTIYYRQDVLRNSWTSKKYNIECQGNTSNCVVLDDETGKPTHSILVTTHYFPLTSKPSGVNSIESH